MSSLLFNSKVIQGKLFYCIQWYFDPPTWFVLKVLEKLCLDIFDFSDCMYRALDLKKHKYLSTDIDLEKFSDE